MAYLVLKPSGREDAPEPEYVLGLWSLVTVVHRVKWDEVHIDVYPLEEAHESARLLNAVVHAAEQSVFYRYAVARLLLVRLHRVAKLGERVCLIDRHQAAAQVIVGRVERYREADAKSGFRQLVYPWNDAGGRDRHVAYAKVAHLRVVQHADGF